MTPNIGEYLSELEADYERSSHQFKVSLYHKESGLKIHTYSNTFTYYEYIEIDSMYPLIGTDNGGTLLTLQVRKIVLD